MLLPTNMFVEGSRTEPGGVLLVGRPELQNYFLADWEAASPTNAVFQDDNIVGGDIVLLIGESLYVDGVDKGTVPGGLTVQLMEASIAGNSNGVIVTAKEDMKFWDGTTFRAVTFPDSADVLKVLEHGHRFIALRKDTHRYYWTEPGTSAINGSGDLVFDALDFASAENEPDELRDALMFRDQLVLGGAKTIEMHGVTGNDDLPWAPTLGSTIPHGVYSTGAMCLFNGSFAWVDESGIVFIFDGSGGTRISTTSIELIISANVWAGLDSFTFDGHEFLRLRAWGTADFLYDAETGEWSEWETDGGAFNGGRSMLLEGINLVFGAGDTGSLYALSRSAADGGTIEDGVTHIVPTGIAINGGQLRIDNILLRSTAGLSTTAEMRFSRDRGVNWSAWRTAATSADFVLERMRWAWRALGMADYPGILFEFRFANNDTLSPFYVSGAEYNVPMGGRSR
jgi:hypothetical protein